MASLRDPDGFVYPPREHFEFPRRLLNFYFAPDFVGMGHIAPERPTIVVANHSTWGAVDTVTMMANLYLDRGVLLRTLVDTNHASIPVWRELSAKIGSVVGSRDNCRKLMAAGASIVVYPGGQREVMKKKSERYQLTWKNRTGFVRMAVEGGYTITPVGIVGCEECYETLADSDDWMRWFGPLLRRSWLLKRGPDELPPLVRGIGLTVIPKPQRLFFTFAEPIEFAGYCDPDDTEALLRGRDRVANALKTSIVEGQRRRAADGGGRWLRRALNSL